MLAGRIRTIKSIAGRKNIKNIACFKPKTGQFKVFSYKIKPKIDIYSSLKGPQKCFEGRSLAMSGLDHGFASGLVRGPHYTLIRVLRAIFR